MDKPQFIPSRPLVDEMGPFTKAELEALRAQRDAPESTLDLTIGGDTEQMVHEIEQEKRRLREAYIESQLKALEGQAEVRFFFAELQDKTKKDFDRSR